MAANGVAGVTVGGVDGVVASVVEGVAMRNAMGVARGAAGAVGGVGVVGPVYQIRVLMSAWRSPNPPRLSCSPVGGWFMFSHVLQWVRLCEDYSTMFFNCFLWRRDDDVM